MIFTSQLMAVKYGLMICYDTAYSTSGVNQIWILKNSKDLRECLSSNSLTFLPCLPCPELKFIFWTSGPYVSGMNFIARLFQCLLRLFLKSFTGLLSTTVFGKFFHVPTILCEKLYFLILVLEYFLYKLEINFCCRVCQCYYYPICFHDIWS